MLSSNSNTFKKDSVVISDESIQIENGEVVNDLSVFTETELEKERKKIQHEVNTYRNEQEEVMKIEREENAQKGYEEGKRQAVKEAEDILRKELEQLYEEANRVYQEANEYKKGLIKRSEELAIRYKEEQEKELTQWMSSCIEEVVGQVIQSEEFSYGKMIEHVLKTIPYESKIIYVRVHPSSKEKFQSGLSEVYGEQIQWLFDLTLEPTDFLIETEREYIDAKMQTKLHTLRKELRGERE